MPICDLNRAGFDKLEKMRFLMIASDVRPDANPVLRSLARGTYGITELNSVQAVPKCAMQSAASCALSMA